MPTIEHRSCTLHYDIRGAGPPIVFIQGVGLHGDGWKPQVDDLKHDFTCLSFDNRGMARSQPVGPAPLTVDLMVEDTLAIADAAGWDTFHLVGHSMGGHISTSLALSAPDRVNTLTLMCTSARGREMPPMTPSMLWTSIRSRIGTRRSRRHAFLEMVLSRHTRETENLDTISATLEPIFGHDLADSPAIVMKQVGAIRKHDVTARLRDIQNIPTLVLTGVEDPLSPPRFGRELADTIPGARHVVIDGHSHGVTVTAADMVNQLLREHLLSQHSGRS